MSGEKSILLQELCLLINVLLCFGVPIIGVIVLNKKYKKVVKPFLIGALAFFISQIVLRIPLIQWILPGFSWYQILQFNPYAYGIFLGLTAGIFEELARLIFMKTMLKNRTRFADGLAFGLGHGGIEAILLAGVNYLVYLVINPMGLVDLSGSSYLELLMGGMERVFAITFHTGASLIVLYGIRTHKAVRYTLLAILLHALLDSMLVILPAATGIGMIGLELFIMVGAVLVLVLGIFLMKRKTSIEVEVS